MLVIELMAIAMIIEVVKMLVVIILVVKMLAVIMLAVIMLAIIVLVEVCRKSMSEKSEKLCARSPTSPKPRGPNSKHNLGA